MATLLSSQEYTPTIFLPLKAPRNLSKIGAEERLGCIAWDGELGVRLLAFHLVSALLCDHS